MCPARNNPRHANIYTYHAQTNRGKKVFCCKAGNMQQYLDICTWTKCGESCPSDKQNVLTTDSGGPRDEGNRCDGYKDGDVFTNPSGQSDDWKDPTKGTKNHRKLCCPKADSFKNCGWKNSKVCSEQCGQGQITLDLDPQGQGGYYCDNGKLLTRCLPSEVPFECFKMVADVLNDNRPTASLLLRSSGWEGPTFPPCLPREPVPTGISPPSRCGPPVRAYRFQRSG